MKNGGTLKTALLFGEGRHEFNVFNFLLKSEKFSVLKSKWFIDTDHASGCSAVDILNACIEVISGKSFHVVLCFIDTDDLKHDYPDDYKAKIIQLEQKAIDHGIEIVWQEENLEDVLFVATDGKIKTKGITKKQFKKHEVAIQRSSYVKDIFHKFFRR